MTATSVNLLVESKDNWVANQNIYKDSVVSTNWLVNVKSAVSLSVFSAGLKLKLTICGRNM